MTDANIRSFGISTNVTTTTGRQSSGTFVYILTCPIVCCKSISLTTVTLITLWSYVTPVFTVSCICASVGRQAMSSFVVALWTVSFVVAHITKTNAHAAIAFKKTVDKLTFIRSRNVLSMSAVPLVRSIVTVRFTVAAPFFSDTLVVTTQKTKTV